MDKETAAPDEQTEEVIEEQIISAQPATELKPASSRNRIIIITVVVLALIGLVYYLVVINPGLLNKSAVKQNEKDSTAAPVTESISDPQIDKDIQAINNKMNALDTDFNNIDYGLADKPVITD